MASIKDLKNNEVTIDATGKKPVINDSEDDVPVSGNKTQINLNGIFEQPKGRHTNVVPDIPSQKRVNHVENQDSKDLVIDATTNNRVVADLSSLPDKTPEEAAYAKEHFVERPIDKIIGDDRDSMLSKYLNRKEEELNFEYELVDKNKKKEELEKQAELTGDDSDLIDFENENEGNINHNVSVLDDDDILSSLDVEEEEDNSMSEIRDEEMYDLDNEPVDVDDSELDDEELYPEDESLGVEEDSDEIEEEEIVEEKPVEKKEVKIENPDIDLEVDQVENIGNDIINNIDESLEIEEEDSSEDVDERDEILKKLQKLATERLKPVSKRLDISSFTVVKKPISNTKSFNVNPVKAAKWVLMNQESTVMMREFTGAELERLREFTQEANSVTSLTKRYRIIYDHIDSPKPASFETWLKTTPYADEDSLFFAIYIASFKGANYIPRDCSDQNECKETWLTEDINIMDMVKFESEEAKKKFTKIYQEEDSSMTKAGLYISERVALSNTVAVAFREPSIYTRIELASLDSEFRNKYAAILDYIPYIDSLYYIDQEAGSLIPVGYKSFTDNNIKTTKSKIQQFAKVLSTLSIDEFGAIRPYVNNVATRTSGINYIMPECTCPKCGKVVEESITTAEELLFTRYQLGALVNTSLN